MSIRNPDDGLEDAASERKESEKERSTPAGEVYEKPQIRPRDEEQEGDFWCD